MPKSNRSNDGAGAAAALAATFHERSGAAAYGMSADRFAAILDEIVRKYVSPGASLISDAHSSSFPTAVSYTHLDVYKRQPGTQRA